MDALSAMVMRNAYGKVRARCSCSLQHTRLEVLLLVVDGDHYVQDRRTGISGREVLPRRQVAGRRVGSHDNDSRQAPCCTHVVALCCACEYVCEFVTDVSHGQRGQMHGEHRTSGHAVDGHRAAVRGRDGLHDGEPETGRAGGAGARGVAAREPFEDMREQVRRNALAVVLDVHADPRLPAGARVRSRSYPAVCACVHSRTD